jgi:PAS domain S-box-containing protein
MVLSSPDAITLRSLPDRRYLEVNEGFVRLTGYSVDEVLGKTPAELDLWVEQEPHKTTLEMVETHGQVKGEEFRFRTKAGEIRYGRVAATRVTINGNPCMLSVTHDITDSKQVEEKLQKSEAHFRSLIHGAPYGIYRVTLDGQLLHVNPALVTMLGYDSEEDLLRRNTEKDIYRDPQTRLDFLKKHGHKEDFRAVEAEWRRKDGKIITVRMTGHPVLGRDNSLAFFEVFAEDITERRTLERQLIQAQKMEAIGRLAGGISHDFNNLLSVILGHSDILEEHLGSNVRLRKSVEATRSAAERAAALTKEIGKGTGLGLSMVYGIIKQNNGYIMAYSEPGRGTTFKIYFPRSGESLPAPHKVEKEIPGGTETILVVEDELALRELACVLLQEAGYTVLESSGVEDAIAIAKDSDRTVDLLLTDVVMPRLDGRELANQLVALRPNLKILFMSGYTDDVIVHRGVLKHGTVLVQKPFTKATLLRKVRETLDAQVADSLASK